jgi:periplasmic protein TonB
MPRALRKHELAAPEPPDRAAIQSVKKQKLAVLLVTGDEALWPQIGADMSGGLVLKQVDSIDELISSTGQGQAGIVLWDARDHTDPAAVLSRLHLHSSRFAIVALDNATSANAWALPIQQRQVVAHVGLPLVGETLTSALDSAHEEVNSRLVLLGDGTAPPAAPSGESKKTWLIPSVVAAVLIAGAVAFMLTRHDASPAKTALPAAEPNKSAPPAAVKSPAEADEKVDALIEKAQQAMLDRHFIDPVAGSALALYREVLIINPDNGEARQGLQRLSEILIARVQSALDDRKFDVALQSLETARSIDANDTRLSALDERIANLRAELGPAQILAAINAQNFDRAAQLIDEATRTKALPAAKLAQLRDEVHRRREEFDSTRLLKLVDARLQQEHLIDPRSDNAVYYLAQAKQAGASASDLQAPTQELLRHLTQAAHTGIEQRHFSDVDRLLAVMHDLGSPASTIAPLQHDLSAARAQAAQQRAEPQYLELAQSRLAQGKLTDPENDSALFYVNQLRAFDPKNSGLPQISGAVQGQILDRARAALDAGDLEKSEALAQLAASLGGSSELDTFNEKMRARKAAAGDIPQVAEQSLTRLAKLEPQYPSRALESGVEGWVEIAYTVAPNGSVTNVKVVNATPPRVFESAAIKAVSRLRYQPVILDGKATAVGTMVRIVFRVPK